MLNFSASLQINRNHPITLTLDCVTVSVICELTVLGIESIIKTGCPKLLGRLADVSVLLRRVKL